MTEYANGGPLKVRKFGRSLPVIVHPDAPRGGPSAMDIRMPFASLWMHPVDAIAARGLDPHDELDAVREWYGRHADTRFAGAENRLTVCPDCRGAGRSLQLRDYHDGEGTGWWTTAMAVCPRCDGSGDLAPRGGR